MWGRLDFRASQQHGRYRPFCILKRKAQKDLLNWPTLLPIGLRRADKFLCKTLLADC